MRWRCPPSGTSRQNRLHACVASMVDGDASGRAASVVVATAAVAAEVAAGVGVTAMA